MRHKSYHHNSLGPAHTAILTHLKPNSKVLEVGCSTGFLSSVLRSSLGCRVTGIEIDATEAEEAAARADVVIVGDVEGDSVWSELGGEFDYILFGDVLEHLKNPWAVLKRARGFLKEGGTVFASIPNVAYYKVRKDLLLGRFDYTDYGILAEDHLRFFTEGAIKSLFAECGYCIRRVERMYRGRVDRTLGRVAPNAFTFQFVVEAVPAPGASI